MVSGLKFQVVSEGNFKFLVVVLTFSFCLLAFIGCATSPSLMPPKPEGIPGIYHRVERGQTLWSISKIYKLDLDEIVKINRIPDAAKIETGQLIFIPHRNKTQESFGKYLAESFIWPIKGKVILTFGQAFNNMVNKGVNIQARHDPNVVASRSGKVVFYSPDFGSFGKTIIIDHGDGFTTVYAKNSEVLVKVGDDIQKGSPIAKIGSSGTGDTYLHFEIRKGFISQNPYFYLP